MKIDFAFKEVFGSEKNKAINIIFLNAILKRTGPNSIKEVIFINLEIVAEYADDKLSRWGILVITQDRYMVNRSMYYWARLYSEQNKKWNDVLVRWLLLLSIVVKRKQHS